MFFTSTYSPSKCSFVFNIIVVDVPSSHNEKKASYAKPTISSAKKVQSTISRRPLADTKGLLSNITKSKPSVAKSTEANKASSMRAQAQNRTSVSKPGAVKFDLKASLQRPLNYKPYTGKLKPISNVASSPASKKDENCLISPKSASKRPMRASTNSIKMTNNTHAMATDKRKLPENFVGDLGKEPACDVVEDKENADVSNNAAVCEAKNKVTKNPSKANEKQQDKSPVPVRRSSRRRGALVQ